MHAKHPIPNPGKYAWKYPPVEIEHEW